MKIPKFLVRLFYKKPLPTPRRYYIPEFAIEEVLLLVDAAAKGGSLEHYRLWRRIEELFPETKGLSLRIQGYSLHPYVEEVLHVRN